MILAPCPFCGKQLKVSHKINPIARCVTPGCWMEQRAASIVLEDPRQVDAWNQRPLSAPGVMAAWTVRDNPEESDVEQGETAFDVLLPTGEWRPCVAVDAEDARKTIAEEYLKELDKKAAYAPPPGFAEKFAGPRSTAPEDGMTLNREQEFLVVEAITKMHVETQVSREYATLFCTNLAMSLVATIPALAAPADSDIKTLVAKVEAELGKGSMSAMDWNASNIFLVGQMLGSLTWMSAKLEDSERKSKERLDRCWRLSNRAEKAEATNADLQLKVDRMREACAKIADEMAGWMQPRDVADRIRALGGSDA